MPLTVCERRRGGRQRAVGGPELSRIISWALGLGASGVASPRPTMASSLAKHALPKAAKSSRTVESAGLKKAAGGLSSKPTMLTLPGTERPASNMARATPKASSSLPHRTAVTREVLGQPLTRLVPGRGPIRLGQAAAQ